MGVEEVKEMGGKREKGGEREGDTDRVGRERGSTCTSYWSL